MPATYPAYPIASDVQAFLTSAGAFDATWNLDLDGFVSAAITEFERGTGYKPFLSTGVDSVRLHDAPGPQQMGMGYYGYGTLVGGGRLLDLDNGLISLTSLTIDSNPWVLNTQFWLELANAPARGEPYEMARFNGPIFSMPQGVAITGKWGYSLTVPSAAWNAIRAGAAFLAYPQIAARTGGGLASVGVGDLSVRFSAGKDAGPYATEAGQWQSTFWQGVDHYRRVTL